MKMPWILAFALIGCDQGKKAPPPDPELDPAKITFGSRTYTVRSFREVSGDVFVFATTDDSLRIDGEPSDRRHVMPCPPSHVLVTDLDGNGSRDPMLYSCGVLSFALDHTKKLSEATLLTAERKEHIWLIDNAGRYPGLDRLVSTIHDVDPDVE